jgi:hypothetical protein
MTLKVAEIETTFTANVKPFDKAADGVEKKSKALAGADPTVVLDANAKPALAAMDAVESGAKKLDATKANPKLDADSKPAQAAIGTVDRELSKIDGTTATAKVDVDDSGVTDLPDTASKAGKEAGGNLAGGIVAALATIPIAGAVVGIGAAIGGALLDGLQNEVRSDLLTARTGLDPLTVAKVARVAGEAYADNFGESIAANMDTARVAIQSGLLNPAATARDSQLIIESLDGVATIIGEDIPRVARSTAQLLKTGLAATSADAFDIIVKGQQAGLNVSEDWLDTLDEYSTQWRKLGLNGGQVLGLLSQGVKAGARDTDIAADALKEFSIRAIDGSKLTTQSFDAIGLSASDMSARIASGGPAAAAALDETLDRLRAVEDPATRAQIAVGLFGTQAEDLGAALFALDLTTATDQLGNLAGVAQSAVAALGDNAAGQIESAQRNIEVAADGIKGALATAFGPQIEGFATFVSENREAVISFLLDIANGGLDAGRALVEAAASATEGFGDMVGTVGPQVLDLIEGILEGLERIPGVDLDLPGFRAIKADAEQAFAAFDAGSETAAESMRTNLIDNGIDPVQDRLNEVGIPLVAQAAVHDASMALAQSIDGIGVAADGSQLSLAGLNGTVDLSTVAGQQMQEQVHLAAAALDEQALKGIAAGDAQADLTTRYDEGRQALVDQLVQMGLTGEQADELVTKYGAVPGKVSTEFIADTSQADAALRGLQARIASLKGDAQRDAITDLRYAAQSSGKGFAGGGYTGDGPADQVAGAVHGKEWVFDASTTARHRGLFQAIQSGQDPAVAVAAQGGGSSAAGYGGPMVAITATVVGTPQDVGAEVQWALTKAGVRP